MAVDVAVVDCGMGNLHSVVAAIRRAVPGLSAAVVSDADAITNAGKVIFPGDGHFTACMQEIEQRGLREPLIQAAKTKPFFGICVGMQVLFGASEESPLPGLGLFPATVKRLPAGGGRKIPHMGWNQTQHRVRALATESVEENTRFYYVHSYCAPVINETLMTATYGTEFSAIVGDGALLATQFHPEKSGKTGLSLLEKFLRA